ncbi:hypothetical protein J4H86_17890 [Spiractinospora alimapuensis]|uniref:hypothetical protein n=1 Tax=Spiractinospora alimapuensis TaxID=2820884 RepID=UPI001F1849C6|nr:hypothetical protein [Spiractinospora alimapuensis]QVQ50740.1 hypothetical protein J4H86_17890 [Spiractinospora alimapuensis]
MTTRRAIEFETATDEAAARVVAALDEAFTALARERPTGVGLEYWRLGGGRRFLAVIELADDQKNPLLGLEATRVLQTVIGGAAVGGYPTPVPVDQVGTYGR